MPEGSTNVVLQSLSDFTRIHTTEHILGPKSMRCSDGTNDLLCDGATFGYLAQRHPFMDQCENNNDVSWTKLTGCTS